MPRKGRHLKGGARTTAEAVAGLVLHPKDSLADFKKFFEELGKIWNNGNIGEGLRQHGTKASDLAVKYLPLGGAPGAAAAAALEKLQVRKWINLLASLIDFVSGKGNIMNFLNALKELVGDIFNILKDTLIHSFAPNGALMTAANALTSAFDPAFAAQREAYEKNEAAIATETTTANDVISMALEDANAKFEESPPESFVDALNVVLGSEQGRGGDPTPDPQIVSAIEDIKKQATDPSGQSLGGNFELQYGRAHAALKLYVVPYFLYLRQHFSERPDEYKEPPRKFYQNESGKQEKVKPLPEIPPWSEQEFTNKIIKAGEPYYGEGPKPADEYTAFTRKFFGLARAIASTEMGYDEEDPENIRKEKEQRDEVARKESERAAAAQEQTEADKTPNKVKRMNTAVNNILKALGLPEFPEGQGPWEVKPDTTPPNPALPKPDTFMPDLNNEKVATINQTHQSPEWFGRSIVWNAYVFGMQDRKNIYQPEQLERDFQTVVTAAKAVLPKPATPEQIADLKATHARLTGPVSMPQITLPTLPPALTGGSHPFHHLKTTAVRRGKRSRTDMLDPFFFEGSM